MRESMDDLGDRFLMRLGAIACMCRVWLIIFCFRKDIIKRNIN